MDHHKRSIAGHTLHPETLMMCFGCDPAGEYGVAGERGAGGAGSEVKDFFWKKEAKTFASWCAR